MGSTCANCGDPVEGWRSQISAPFKFCCEQCCKEFVEGVFSQLRTDDAEYKHEFMQRLEMALE